MFCFMTIGFMWEATSDIFFLFLQIQSNEACALNLGSLLSMAGDDDGTFIGHLLRMQSRELTECFFEKLRGNASVDMARSKLPSFLFAKEFDVEQKWFLCAIIFHV